MHASSVHWDYARPLPTPALCTPTLGFSPFLGGLAFTMWYLEGPWVVDSHVLRGDPVLTPVLGQSHVLRGDHVLTPVCGDLIMSSGVTTS